MRLRVLSAITVSLLLMPLHLVLADVAVDSDGDGLSDYQEIHKYLTDPHKADTGGDGVPDSDWNKRREYTYSIRTILRVMPPAPSLEVLNDDYQDARILARTDEYVELEVIHYPLATVEKIPENRNWRAAGESMKEFLKPGITTNWDEQMRRDVLADLKRDGIDVDKLTDKEVVEKVSTWAIRRGRSLDKVFTTYYIHCPDGKPAIYPGLEAAFKREFERDSANYNWTIDQHFDHELLGRGMYYNKTHGSCTSSAVYLTTVLRAVGIPTRMVIAIPAADCSDPEQVQMLRGGISHKQVHFEVLRHANGGGQGAFSAHTFNEVFIGDHWHRLNYNRLDQSIVDPTYLGLMTHLYTFNDLSEIDLAATWGRRYARGMRDNEFATANPYKALSVSDHFGVHAHIDNPEPVRPRRYHSEPNIVITQPESLPFSAYQEVNKVVEGHVWSRWGRPHSQRTYEELFDSSQDLSPGDLVVLVFTLDQPGRVPKAYEDLLPRRWEQVEEALKKGQVVEAQGKARGFNVVLLAAPDGEQLRRLINQTRLLRFWDTRPVATQPATTNPATGPANTR